MALAQAQAVSKAVSKFGTALKDKVNSSRGFGSNYKLHLFHENLSNGNSSSNSRNNSSGQIHPPNSELPSEASVSAPPTTTSSPTVHPHALVTFSHSMANIVVLAAAVASTSDGGSLVANIDSHNTVSQEGSEPSSSTIITTAASITATQANPVHDAVFVWVLRLLEMHGKQSIEVLHPALKLLLVVCNYNAHAYHWGQVAQQGGCGIIVEALQNVALKEFTSTSTCELAVQVLLALALSSAEIKDILCKLDAHNNVVEMLQNHGPVSLFLCEVATQTLVLLYEQVPSREANEGSPLACKTILQLLPQYEHQSVRFLESGVCMLKTLAMYTPNRRLLGQQGTCTVLVRILREHTLQEGYRNVIIAGYGVEALSNLAGLEENQARIAKSGGCKVVVEIIREYGNVYLPMAEQGLSALSVLAVGNKVMLGEVGACAVIMDIIKHYITTQETHNESITNLASLAIYNLSVQYGANKERFLRLGAAEVLKQISLQRELSHPTRAQVKDAINMIRF